MSWENQGTNIVKKEIKAVPQKIEFKTLAESKKERGIKILSYGNFSTGKTHFALTSTKPVFIIDTENGASPLADKFPDAKVINICNVDGGNIEENDEVKNYETFVAAIDTLISMPDNEVGTIIVDSVSDIWSWAQAYGKVKVFKISPEDRLKQQWDWGTINKLYLKPILKLINKNCDVILTARESEKYLGAGQPSGTYEPKCQKTTPFWVDVVLYHYISFMNKEIKFSAKINKCRHNGKIINKIIEEPTLDKIKKLIEEK